MTHPNANDWTPLSPRSLNISAFLHERQAYKPAVIQGLLSQCTSAHALQRVLQMPAVRSGLRDMQHLALPTCNIHPSDLEILSVNATGIAALTVPDMPELMAAMHSAQLFDGIVQLSITSPSTLSAAATTFALSFTQLRVLELQCAVTREQIQHLRAAKRSLRMRLQRYHGVLWESIRHHETTLLFALREMGADINQCDEHKMTLLTAAVAQDRLEAIPLLLAAGADLHVCDGHGFTPIAWAALRGNVASLRLLVELGADIYRLDPHARSPLDLAIRANGLAAVRYLVSVGAPVRGANDRGSCALIEAVLHGELDLVRFMVGAGADTTATDKLGLNACSHASLVGKHAIVDYLRKRA